MTTQYAVVDPSTNETGQEYPTATDQDVQAAMASVTKAHREWSRTSTVDERVALMHRVAELHTERQDELV
ncbi:MAG: aldehyde dehydrogenase family protein, partial [Allobranchiibius sp.]